MTSEYRRSALWEVYHETRVTKDASADLSEFKSADVNFKLGLWDPRVNGVRYLKALIYNLAEGVDAAGWERLRRIRNRETGRPIAVRYRGELVCMDYLQAVLELGFIAGELELAGASVLEIGAGYGRTCHAILANHDVGAYHIVDLENSLELARAYLRHTLDERDFARVRFIAAGDLDGLADDIRFDLCINIDSFAEMDAETVRSYLRFITARCRHLYVKNPVGKYLDKSLDDHSQGAELVRIALSTGLLRDIIDIHDGDAVREQSRAFITAYRPAADWECVADAWARPWSFYWQALYRAGRSA